MSDDREMWQDDQHNPPDVPGGEPTPDADPVHDAESGEVTDDYPLLTADDFEDELEALAVYTADQDFEFDDRESDEADLQDVDAFGESPGDGELYEDVQDHDLSPDASLLPDDSAEQARLEADEVLESSPEVDAEDRLRQPRAGRFRRTMRNQIGMLPLALFMIGLGAYLIARGQDVAGLPDLSDGVLSVIGIVVGSFTMVFYALLFGRRERGLLFVGLWVLITVGLIAALIYGVDDDPEASKWWPLLFWSTGLALVFTYLVERTHDVRLVLLSIIAFVIGTTAYLVSNEQIDNDVLQDAADYWPLLLSVLGIGLLPLVFRRDTETE